MHIGELTYTVEIHNEDGSLWAEVLEVPGCFASGDSLEELVESLSEALSFVLSRDDCAEPDCSVTVAGNPFLSNMAPVRGVERRALQVA